MALTSAGPLLPFTRRAAPSRARPTTIPAIGPVTSATAQPFPAEPSAEGAASPAVQTAPAATAAAPPNARLTRLHGDSYLIARPRGGNSLAFGQLGASQLGVRLTYTVDEVQRLAVSGRVSAPFRGAGREAALGVDWQPTVLPVHLLVEQRLPVDGGTARPAVQLIAGAATRLPVHLRFEAYGQAGAVHHRGGFADGAATVTRALIERRRVRVDVGAGSWSAAQRGVSRLDLGPTVALTLPARVGAVRLGLDYRARVAGRARPGSGAALTLGSSF